MAKKSNAFIIYKGEAFPISKNSDMGDMIKFVKASDRLPEIMVKNKRNRFLW